MPGKIMDRCEPWWSTDNDGQTWTYVPCDCPGVECAGVPEVRQHFKYEHPVLAGFIQTGLLTAAVVLVAMLAVRFGKRAARVLRERAQE